jgi:retinol dehydrogenase-12
LIQRNKEKIMTEPRILSGKTAVVTGATSGIGLYSLLALAQAGASVIGVGRSPERNHRAEAFIRQQVPGAQVQYLLADLSLQSQVRQLANHIQAVLSQGSVSALDILVNNAGMYAQRKTYTTEGIETLLAVNHLAVFLLTHELLPLLLAAPEGRVVTVSSNSHYWARLNPARLNRPLFYVGFYRYGQTKLANILFTQALRRRTQGSTLSAFAVDPGLVNTDIGVKEAGGISKLVWSSRSKKGTPPEVPARTVLFLSSDPGVRGHQAIYWRDSQPKDPSPRAQQVDLAEALWVESERLCDM